MEWVKEKIELQLKPDLQPTARPPGFRPGATLGGQPELCINTELIIIRPLFVGIMFFIRNFQKWYAGGRVITIIHYTH